MWKLIGLIAGAGLILLGYVSWRNGFRSVSVEAGDISIKSKRLSIDENFYKVIYDVLIATSKNSPSPLWTYSPSLPKPLEPTKISGGPEKMLVQFPADYLIILENLEVVGGNLVATYREGEPILKKVIYLDVQSGKEQLKK